MRIVPAVLLLLYVDRETYRVKLKCTFLQLFFLHVEKKNYINIEMTIHACGSAVVETLWYKLEGHRFKTR
jgi:hypothetical protein